MRHRGRWSASITLAVVGLTSLALVSAAGASHSVVDRVSIGPAGGNGASGTSQGISRDGTHVFFHTWEPLVSADTDGCQDVYERTGGTTTLVSTGPAGPSGYATWCHAEFSATSQDGTRVFFTTAERFGNPDPNDQDTDKQPDIYERSGGTTTLISGKGDGRLATENAASFLGVSQDGSRVFFRTSEQIALTGDADGREDIYERSGGKTTLVSTGPAGGNGAFTPTFGAISADGTRVFFTTSESLVASDHDGTTDIYERSGGTTTLVSPSVTDGAPSSGASLGGISQDGTRVFFKTDEQLVGADTDTSPDVYERAGGTTTLVSTGPTGGSGAFDAGFSGTSQDGTRVFFTTAESMVGGDTDNLSDVYERSGGTTTQISVGPTGGNGSHIATLAGLSADGARVFFTTSEALVASDTDSTNDIYERAVGTTSLLSTGPAGGNGPIAASFAAASSDGSRVFFNTTESLVSADTDAGASDIYERTGGTTTLISTGPANPQKMVPARFERISRDGTRAVFSTTERLTSGDTDDALDVYVASTHPVTTGFPRPKSATPLFLPLVPVYEQCASGNTTHGAPFAFESCNPPVPTSDYLTVGTPDANGQAANSVGSVRLKVLLGDPSTPADEADIAIAFSLTDVRKQSDLSDYAGDLLISTSLRITDKLNGSSQALPGTVADMPFGFTAPCAATGDTATGGNCTLNTTFDALVAGGAVKEGKRSIFKLLGDVEVYDGGADGALGTSGDNTLFAGSGLFVP